MRLQELFTTVSADKMTVELCAGATSGTSMGLPLRCLTVPSFVRSYTYLPAPVKGWYEEDVRFDVYTASSGRSWGGRYGGPVAAEAVAHDQKASGLTDDY